MSTEGGPLFTAITFSRKKPRLGLLLNREKGTCASRRSVTHSVRPLATPGRRQAPQSISISRTWLKFTSAELMMPSNLSISFSCQLLLLSPSTFPSTRLYLQKILSETWEYLTI